MNHPMTARFVAVIVASAALGAPALARQNSDDKSPINRTGKSKLPPPPPAPPRPANGQAPSQSPAASRSAGSLLNRSDGNTHAGFFVKPVRPTLGRGFMTSQARQVLANGGGTVLTGNGEVRVGTIYDPRGATRSEVQNRLVDAARTGDLPHDNESLQRLTAPRDLAELRREYREKGFSEAQLADGRTAFIQARNVCSMSRAVAILNGRDPCSCCCDDDPWSPNDVMGSPDAPADPFVALEGSGDDPALGTMTVQEQAELGISTQELAERALKEGRAEEAVRLFDAYFAEDPANKEDSEGMRAYALARMRAKKMDDGIKAMHEAYAADPDLAWRVVDPGMFKDGERALRELVDGAVKAANRAKGGDGKEWLAVVVLMQAQGRSDQAVKMLDRAKERGLDERIVAEFSQSLKDRKPALSGDALSAR